MNIGEFEPIAQEDYGSLLMDAFRGIRYESAAISGVDKYGSAQVTDVKQRHASDFDTEQGTWWTLHDTLNTIEVGGRVAIGRVVVLEEQDSRGTTRLRLWTPQENGVSVDDVDHELPPDFSPREELMKGLRFLAKGNAA